MAGFTSKIVMIMINLKNSENDINYKLYFKKINKIMKKYIKKKNKS